MSVHTGSIHGARSSESGDVDDADDIIDDDDDDDDEEEDDDEVYPFMS